MAATLSSNYPYYIGREHEYLLKSAIADDGGSEAQYELLSHLIQSSITAIPEEGPKLRMFDTRAGQVNLFLFPPKVQVLLAYLFSKEDADTLKYYTEQEGSDFKQKIISNIPSSVSLLRLSESVTSVNFSNTIKASLDREETSAITHVIGMDSTIEFISKDDLSLYDKLDRIFNCCDYQVIGMDAFQSIVVNGDRVKAGVMASRGLGFSERTVQSVAQVIERWIYSI
jgi:hypothetical protein